MFDLSMGRVSLPYNKKMTPLDVERKGAVKETSHASISRLLAISKCDAPYRVRERRMDSVLANTAGDVHDFFCRGRCPSMQEQV